MYLTGCRNNDACPLRYFGAASDCPTHATASSGSAAGSQFYPNIICDETSSVIELNLSSCRLNGSFDPRYNQLTSLVALKLTNNSIRGSLPPLSNTVKTLQLSTNRITALPDPLPSGLRHIFINNNLVKNIFINFLFFFRLF